MKIKVFLVVIFFILLSEQSFACENFQSIPSEAVKEYRDVLLYNKSDPFDQLFAFEKLSCSDNPNIRSYAIKSGINHSADPLVRNQVLLIAMMQKTRVDVEMGNKASLSNVGKKFFSDNSGIYSVNVRYKSQKDGCLSFSNRKQCESGQSVYVKGDKVEFNYQHADGQFQLSDQGELIGFLIYRGFKETARIPAVIKLF